MSTPFAKANEKVWNYNLLERQKLATNWQQQVASQVKRCPFTAVTRVRIPLGSLLIFPEKSSGIRMNTGFKANPLCNACSRLKTSNNAVCLKKVATVATLWG